MATVIIEVNVRTKAGKAILELARLLIEKNKGISIRQEPKITAEQEIGMFFSGSRRSMSPIISKYL